MKTKIMRVISKIIQDMKEKFCKYGSPEKIKLKFWK
jgi:hypothetical protein